jgi:hypothetical protein
MSPNALGDALLTPGHPTILETRVGVQGMMPPPPPDTPFQSPIDLVVKPEVSSEQGFCERSVAHVLLAPVVFSLGKDLAARPVQISTEQTYSWIVNSGEGAECDAHYRRYFSLQKGYERQVLTLVRSLAELQARVKAGRRIAPKITVDDREAPKWRKFAQTNKDPRIQPTAEDMTPLTDGKVALSSISIGNISSVEFGRQSWHAPLKDKDLTGKGGAARDHAALFASGEWTLDVALDGSRIALIRMVRETPPPF